MLSASQRLLHLLFIVSTFLASAFTARDAPDSRYTLVGVDRNMHASAMNTIRRAQPDMMVYRAMRLPYYRDREHRLAEVLHRQARIEPGVMHVGSATSKSAFWWLGIQGKTSTYYASRLTPTSSLADSFGLTGTDEHSPNGKEAWAFWKHKDGRVKLLSIDTVTHTGVNFDFQPLDELIPLDQVRKII